MSNPAERIFGRFMQPKRPLVRFRRRGGVPPSDWEMLEIAASGQFTLWRSVSRSGKGGGKIGRFAGALPAVELAELTRALSGCTGKATAGGHPPADSSMDSFRCKGGELTIAADATPPAAWREAVGQLRALLESLTGHPRAAIGIEAHGDGARLAHLGTEPLELDLSNGAVRIVRWDDGAISGQWSARLEGPRSATATPGWSFPVPFAHDLGANASLTVSVDNFLAFDGEFWRVCGLQTNLEGG